MQVSRRGLLAGAAVGGGLVVAWALWPREYRAPLTPGRGEWAYSSWLKIGRDGVVTVAVPQLEMGQGVTTVLPQIVAAELGADWRTVAVEPAPVSGAYPNLPLAAKWAPLWMPFASGLADDPRKLVTRRWAESTGFTATAEGSSLAAYEGPAREAAAAARAMLCMAAADRWDVSWEECEVRDGIVVHAGRHLSFAALAEHASSYDPPDPPPVRPEPYAEAPAASGEIESLVYPRLDLPAKVDGTFPFAGDIRLPGMLYAAIRQGPIGDTELEGFDEAAGATVRGLRAVVRSRGWLAAVADTWWAAEQALSAMSPVWQTTGRAGSERIDDALDAALTVGEASRIATRGAGDSGKGEPTVTHRYEIAPATHATIETATATARLADGKLELWVASQAPALAKAAAAKAVGLSAEDAVLYPMAAGGSFDRRLEHDHAIQAAVIAKAAGAPVQLVWSRWQEHVGGRPRAPLAALASAWTAQEDGTPTALRLRVAMPSTTAEFGARLFGNKTALAARRAAAAAPDPLAFEGATTPYAIPDVAIDHVPVDVGLPSGRLRGNAHGYLAFITESFIDELAARVGREPLGFRMALLGSDPRLAECLQRAARLGEWDGGSGQSGNGIACWRIGDPESGGPVARIACVASARAGEGGVRVEKLSVAVDLGRIVNLDIARQQIEGGLIFGVGLATGSALQFQSGLPTTSRLGALGLPALADSPEIAVDFIPGEGEPADPGEIGVAVAPPAIANALHSATGLRLRRLPLLSEGL
ncbi:molybdopterin-dependent oxidoreductase [Tsuneonella sp. YG55]|uniref:Molybdopterin-dependent oxidoreductase n=1 Tax=Tsuneonella litorea TaxID=2976475 RepID=A0A9X2VYP1_9SPHN|nr:molybdopterin cofactor-binding domain-containing protein [Tsuneonella litorea]MCT2557556.1 molybdopterin-dependent oxidoreductase [Tsuneonella litorea]